MLLSSRIKHFRRYTFTYLINKYSDLWNVYSLITWNFIDLIKGIVPKDLFTDILYISRSLTLARSILCDFLNYIHSRVHQDIWIPRCNAQIAKEKSLGITNHKKKLSTGSSRNPSFSIIWASDFSDSSEFLFNFIKFFWVLLGWLTTVSPPHLSR